MAQSIDKIGVYLTVDKSMLHRVSFVCNSDKFLEVESSFIEGVSVSITDKDASGEITFYKFRFPFPDKKTLHWSIDSDAQLITVSMNADYALGLINLLKQKKWNLSEAYRAVSKKWDKPFEVITWKDIDLDEPVQANIIDPNQLDLFSPPIKPPSHAKEKNNRQEKSKKQQTKKADPVNKNLSS